MSDSPTRVLLWSPSGSGDHYSGPASFTYRLYSNAPAGRVQVSLVHGLEEQEQYSIFEQQDFICDFERSPWHLMRFIQRGNRWLDNNLSKFDVMHCNGAFHSSVVPAAHAERAGLPAVLFISNHRTQLADKGGLKGLLRLPRKRRKLIKQLSALIAMSTDIYKELLEYNVPEEKIAQIPMGVNTKVFRPPNSDTERNAIREELGWLKIPTLIFVGGIVRRKRPDLLIEAIGNLKRRGLDCQLAVIGPDHDPEYTAHMKKQANALGIANQVVWFGFTRDIAKLFRAADYFGLPSSNEGMAAALIEAMACGLPAIVTPVSGSIDAVQDGVVGRIVRPDANDIADHLAEYLLNPQLATKHGEAARERVVNHYSDEYVFDAYDRLFRRIMHGGPAAE